MRIFAFVVFALFLGASPASAWREYLYLDQGVAIEEFSPSRLHSAAQARRVNQTRSQKGFSAGANYREPFLATAVSGWGAGRCLSPPKAAICMDKVITYSIKK